MVPSGDLAKLLPLQNRKLEVLILKSRGFLVFLEVDVAINGSTKKRVGGLD